MAGQNINPGNRPTPLTTMQPTTTSRLTLDTAQLALLANPATGSPIQDSNNPLPPVPEYLQNLSPQAATLLTGAGASLASI
ncbi:MAG: hypothetical protein M1829_002450 [Trizodia sp. TS-e1964]|nr:MAG: hypothetical protein M1829_002450 [Trizodia sp. TS-e1964]